MILDAPILPSAVAVSTSVMTIIPEAWRSVAQLASPVCYPRGRIRSVRPGPPTVEIVINRHSPDPWRGLRPGSAFRLAWATANCSRPEQEALEAGVSGSETLMRIVLRGMALHSKPAAFALPGRNRASRARSGLAGPLRHLRRQAAYCAEFPRLRVIRQSLRRLTILGRLGATSAS